MGFEYIVPYRNRIYLSAGSICYSLDLSLPNFYSPSLPVGLVKSRILLGSLRYFWLS